MKFQLETALPILERTPQLLRIWLQDLPEGWTAKNEGGYTWSPYDIVGHLIHGEKTDWIPRMKIILTQGSSQPFEPFDRFAQFQASEGKTLEQLLNDFADLRAENVAILKAQNLQESDLEREGTHPELGKVVLKELLSAWTVHDLGHINQIARVMAKQYKSEVGVWGQYLTVLGK